MQTGVPQIFYRYVSAPEMSTNDFRSQGALGRTMRSPGDQGAWNNGISVWATLESARSRAQEINYSAGSYVVELVLPEGHGLKIKGPTGRSKSHYTIFGADPQYLLSCAGNPVKMPGAP